MASMKKVLIVTIYDAVPNYGNKLQNYASKKILEQCGFEVSTLITEPQPSITMTRMKRVINRITMYRFRDKTTHRKWDKYLTFDSFNKKYLNPDSSYIKGRFNPENYDYFAVGSDQVWNPLWYSIYPPKKDLFLLTFAKPGQKICMAPSFGIDILPDEWTLIFKEALSSFPHLSVREKSGVDLICNLTGKKAQLLIDPTLMLGKDEWSKLARKPLFLNEDEEYIVTYFIGEQSKQNREYVDNIAKQYNYKIFNLNDVNDTECFSLGPEEFLYMIKNAKIVMTDSFHACVFSFLFERPFEVFERKSPDGNMMSRIYTFLETFSLERKYSSYGFKNNLFECDYCIGMERLIELRKSFIDYIKDCTNIK